MRRHPGRDALVAWLAAAAALWLGACATGAPGWIDGTSEAHPRERYWIGVGEGDDLDTARTRARAEIARIFEVKIEDTVTDSQRQTRTGAAAVLDERLDVVTRSKATGTFEGVEIAETWTDPDTRRRYALAVLDLPKAHTRYRDRAAQNDRLAASWADKARAESDPLDVVRAWLRALSAADERDLWARRAALVRGGRQAASSPGASTAEIEAGLAAATAALKVAVEAEERGPGGRGPLPELSGDLRELFASFGFATTEGRDVAQLLARCELAFQTVPRGDPQWTHYGWNGTCDVSRSGTVWIATTGKGSESHRSPETALIKARTIARSEMVTALRQRLAEALESDE